MRAQLFLELVQKMASGNKNILAVQWISCTKRSTHPAL